MKKHLLGLAVLGTLGLAGCGGDGPAEPTESPLPPGVALTKAIFESSDADADGYTVPLPNDLLFADTKCGANAQPNTDLTLNIPCVSDANLPTTLEQVGVQNSDPTAGTKRGQAALSKLDGWSTTAPFSVKFKNADASVGIDPATVVAGETVRVFEVSVHLDLAAPGIPKPTGLITGVVRELSADDFGVEVAADCALTAEQCAALTTPLSKTTQYIRVLPKKPLKFRTTYAVVYTNGIKDSHATSVVADSAYGVAKNTTPLPSDNAAFGLQQFVNALEGAVVATGVDRGSIVLSHQFTTQSRAVMTYGVPAVMSSPQVMAVVTGVGSPATKPTFATLGGAPLGMGFENFTATPGASFATVRFGEMMVPYFSKPTTSANLPNTLSLDPGPVLEMWKSVDAIPGSSPSAANPFAPNLPYALPVPKPQGTFSGFERIPMLVTTPSGTSGCTKPTAGWPVVIFQHGITGNRTNALGLAIAASASPTCHAIVAIDQPLHGITVTDPLSVGVKAATDALTAGNGFQPFRGYAIGGARERTFGLDLMNNATSSPFSGTNVYGAGVPGDGVVDSSGSWFINLYSLGTTRENLRQAAVDLMALKLAIPVMDYDNDGTPDFNGSRITTIGQSLGGIAVTSFSALDQLKNAEGASVYPGQKLNASVLNVPGGGLVKMLDGSMSFGPRIRAGLAAGGLTAGTLGYEQFMWLAQTLVDSGDPINYADILAGATDYPVLMQSVVGTGATFPDYTAGGAALPSDLVVPNATVAGTFANPVTASAYTVYSAGPLAGTEPLLSAIGLPATSTAVTTPSVDPIRAAVRFTVGHHSVLLSTDMNGNGTSDATETALFGPARAEMQTQAMSFLASKGHLLYVNFPTVATTPTGVPIVREVAAP